MGCIYGKKIKQLQKKVKTLEESGSQGGDLATVATTGDYNDLENLPAIPTPTAVKGDAESSYRTGNVNITPANIGLGNVGNFKAVSTAANQGLTDIEKSNARANIGAGTSSFSGDYSDLSNKPTIPTVYNWAQAQNKPSYNYSEISGTPTIPDTTGMVTSSTSGLKIEVVAALPASPDANTIYIVQ